MKGWKKSIILIHNFFSYSFEVENLRKLVICDLYLKKKFVTFLFLLFET